MNMMRKYWLELGPGLLVGVGIIASTCVASRAETSGWLVLAGPLLLAAVFVAAAMLDARATGRPPEMFAAALMVGISFVLAGVILVVRGGSHVTEFVPIMGAAGWVTLLPRRGNRRASCAGAWGA